MSLDQSVSPRILICDDDGDTRSILQLTLSAQGFQIIESGSAKEAMEQCSLSLPDAIVMDILMPEVSGIEFVRWFRKHHVERFVPIILLTALTEIESRVEGLNAGADDYITKPFHHKELIARVEAVLRIRDLTERLSKQSQELAEANKNLLLTQEALIQKERELAVIQLAGAAAHNLRQPVTSILLNCHLLEQRIGELDKKSAVADEFVALVAAVRRECQFMEAVIAKMSLITSEQTEDYLGKVKITSLVPQKKD